MKLGISSLGYVVDLGLSSQFNSLPDLLLKATESCLTFAEENGIGTCELVLEPLETLFDQNIEYFIELCNSFKKIKKQIHGPFLDLNLCSHNVLVHKATIETYKKSAEISEKIKANILTIHPGIANYLIKSILQYNQEKLINGIDEIVDNTKDFNVLICVENMPKMVNFFLTIDDIDSFFKKINRNDIFMTWDTSHSWTCDIDVELLWKKFNKLIKNIHLVDNKDKETDLHPALGAGTIEFGKIIDIVKNYDYKGALIVELSSAKGLLQSIEHMKKFL